ncbi:M48 family metallopeptidase [Nocardiopsis lambiniae]|uniref:M48 family metallopeptidase n=1 Tax=Nocardiopsis lambiniae TaxID=3075539 RepID=UPI0037C8C90A
MSCPMPVPGRSHGCSVHGVSGCGYVPENRYPSAPYCRSVRPDGRGPYELGEGEEIVPAPAHPWEAPLLLVCVVVNLVVLASAGHLVGLLTGTWRGTVLVVVLVPAVYWAVRGLRHARHRAESVKVSPTQFPEAHRIIVTLSTAMGVRVPEAYVRVDGGPADAGAHGLRRYLVLSGELFDDDGRVGDPDALAFAVAHQLGHVVAGHTGFWRRVAVLGADLVPLLGAALARCSEYTADNHAYAHFPEGAHTVRAHAGGARLYPRVNMGEMADRARTDRGCSLLLYHLLSRRPSNVRRMAALRDRGRRGRIFL